MEGLPGLGRQADRRHARVREVRLVGCAPVNAFEAVRYVNQQSLVSASPLTCPRPSRLGFFFWGRQSSPQRHMMRADEIKVNARVSKC